MHELDLDGLAYTVEFNYLGFPECKGATVVSHSEDWVEVQHTRVNGFINLRHVANFKIHVH
jgi:hypothetical protein